MWRSSRITGITSPSDVIISVCRPVELRGLIDAAAIEKEKGTIYWLIGSNTSDLSWSFLARSASRFISVRISSCWIMV